MACPMYREGVTLVRNVPSRTKKATLQEIGPVPAETQNNSIGGPRMRRGQGTATGWGRDAALENSIPKRELVSKYSGLTMRVLQVNLNRSRAAHDLLKYVVGRLEIDLCVLSEPNIGIAVSKRADGWSSDDTGDTAIWWTRRDRHIATSG